MKKLTVLLAFSLLWFGCHEESADLIPSDNDIDHSLNQEQTSEEASQRSQQTRPFKGTIVYNNVNSNSLDSVCDCPSGFPVLLEGSGQITHMGQVSSPAKYCFVPYGASNCPGHLVLKECLYVVAANGDEVHLNVDAPYETCIEPGCCITGTLQGAFDGGTGKFQNAKGDWTAEFIQYLDNPSSEVTVDGDIMY